MLYSFQDLVYSASLAVYVAVSVVVATVRWGHKCAPFSRHMDYYFPAWKVLVWCFMSAVLLVPAIFLPHETDAVNQVRIMLILSSPFYCAVIMFTYFGKVLRISWWRKPIYALGFPFGYMLLTTFAHTLAPGDQMEGFIHRLIFGITGVLSLLYLICFVMSFVMVLRAMRKYSEDNYSNPNDFPSQYASSVLYLPILHIGISWAGAIIGTKIGLSICVVAQSVLNVVFLIGALSPHRARDVAKLETCERHASAEEEQSLSKARGNEILKKLRHLVEEDQAFLDSHLTLDVLARNCGVNRTYVSRVMNDNLGGFFHYVNRCRLDYAEKLKAQHPEMSVDDLATASGFGSRQSYYNIRRNLIN